MKSIEDIIAVIVEETNMWVKNKPWSSTNPVQVGDIYVLLKFLEKGKKFTYLDIVQFPLSLHPQVLNHILDALTREEVINPCEEGFRISADVPWATPSLCRTCKGTTIDVPFSDALRTLEKIASQRPPINTLLDQCPVTVLSSVRRISLAADRGLMRKDLIFLGDCDLSSIAAGLIMQPGRIQVLELDPHLLHFLRNQSHQYNIKIDVEQCDLRAPVPDKFQGKFDAVFCDPPASLEGMKMFFLRGKEVLKKGGLGFFTVVPCFLDKKRLYQIQEWLTSLGFLIEERYKNFHQYDIQFGKKTLIFSSDLYVVSNVVESVCHKDVSGDIYAL